MPGTSPNWAPEQRNGGVSGGSGGWTCGVTDDLKAPLALPLAGAASVTTVSLVAGAGVDMTVPRIVPGELFNVKLSPAASSVLNLDPVPLTVVLPLVKLIEPDPF